MHYVSTPHHQALNQVVNNSKIKQIFRTLGIASTWSREKSKFIENNLISAKMVNTPVWLCEIVGNSYLSHVANICNTLNWWGNGLLYKLSSPPPPPQCMMIPLSPMFKACVQTCVPTFSSICFHHNFIMSSFDHLPIS